MKRKIAKFAARQQMFSKGSSVLVAVSGGVDSMALLHYLYTRQHDWEITVLAAHCNHGLREDARREEVLVKQFCEERNIPFFLKNLGLKKEQSTAIQQIAREKRYAFFAEVMQTHGMDVLATAHHGDDQVETVLMKQMRGFNYYSGQLGIAADRPFASGKVVRPFLSVTKEEIIDYASRYAIPWYEDTSNQSEDYTRNRVRKHILPTVKKENKEVHAQFQRLVEDLREDALYLHQQAEKIVEESANIREDECIITLTWFRQYPIPLQRRVIHLLLNYLYYPEKTQFSRLHIDDCLELIANKHPSARRSLPGGVSAVRNYAELRLTAKQEQSLRSTELREELHTFPAKVDSILGPLSFEQTQVQVSCHEETSYCCPIAQLSLPLYVRNRRPGDVIRPLGLGGTQKLKQTMIDAKVPRPKRDQWLVIIDATGKILWAPLLKKNEDASLQAKDHRYLVICLAQKTEAKAIRDFI